MMPTKMISDTPLPTPYSVMSSPSHIAMIVPAVSVRMMLISVAAVGLAMIAPTVGDLRVGEQREVAERLQHRERHGEPARVARDLLAPDLAFLAQLLEPDGDDRHQLHDDRGVDVGVQPERDEREALQAAAAEEVEQPEQRVAREERR